jgi:hypothetical protein
MIANIIVVFCLLSGVVYGQDFGSELGNLDFGSIIGGPLLACITAQVRIFHICNPFGIGFACIVFFYFLFHNTIDVYYLRNDELTLGTSSKDDYRLHHHRRLGAR